MTAASPQVSRSSTRGDHGPTLHRSDHDGEPAWLTVTAPVLRVSPHQSENTRGWIVSLATIPPISCLLLQPWAEHLRPGKDWLTVAGIAAGHLPQDPTQRVLLVRCSAALSRSRQVSATWQLSGTVDEIAIHGQAASILLSYPASRRSRGREQLDCVASRETALRAASVSGTARFRGTMLVQSSSVRYHVQEVHSD